MTTLLHVHTDDLESWLLNIFYFIIAMKKVKFDPLIKKQ